MSAASFWLRVAVRGPDECWPWLGARNTQGYGVLHYEGKTTRAHRVALELKLGEGLGDLYALHSCDNPPCCNPAHLRPGTHAENMRERSERGRQISNFPAGEEHYAAKLTAARVVEIRRRAESEPQKDLAAEFGVSRAAICRAVNGQSWSSAQ